MRKLILVLGLWIFAAPAHGQETQTLGGKLVWVRSPNTSGRLDAGVKGMLEGSAGDSLQLRLAGGDSAVSVGFGSQTQLYVFTGRRSSAGRGAAIGGGLGGLAGVVIGLATDACSGWICFSRGELVAGGAVVLGGTGLVIGLIVGALSPHDVWARVASSQTVRPVITPTGHGVDLGFSFSF